MRHAGVLLLLLTLLAPVASAHAVLKASEPSPNGRASAGLAVVVIEFTEDVERQYTDADVLDVQGESWKAGPIEFDASRRNVIRVPVRPLEDGIYSASWKALSADTHTTRGTFVFAIGTATLRPGQYEPIVDVTPPEEVARDGFARFAFYAGLFLVAGVPLFALVVLREHAPAPALFRTAAAFGVVGALAAMVGLVFLADRTGLGAAAARTGPGLSLVARGVLVLAAASACAWAAARPAAWRPASLAALGLALGGVVATAVGSHAAALRENTLVYVAADAVHLAAGAVWIGGIVAFLHVVWGRSPLETSQLVHRFGFLAVPSVLALLATGFLASVAHIPCFADGPEACLRALRTERYMQLVALKLALMAPLVALGAFNKYTVGPRLARGAWSPSRFSRVVQAEAALMGAILLAAGVLAASAPPETRPETGAPLEPPILEFQNTTERSHVILQVSPNPVPVGVQKLVVIVHPLGPTLPNGTLVALKIWQEGEREPHETLNPEKVTPNEWEIEDGLFTSPGTWNVLVIVQRPDEYVRLLHQVPVSYPGS
ncbi:MAG TPA: CopD family protein [Candidatus Thermoplasmatota archaeon]|nr:CopD family protein [Candidatus Thermoplasmatota archaeon]